MKVKQICLSDDLHRMISKEDNASRLVSELLDKHYSRTKVEGKSLEEINLMINKLEQAEALEKQAKELKNELN